MFLTLVSKALEGRVLTDSELYFLEEMPAERLPELLRAARTVRDHCLGNRVSLCAIVNARSGKCPENCAFCAQSGHHACSTPQYPYIGPQAVAQAGKQARAQGLKVFSIVTSGTRPGNGEFPQILASVRALRELGLEPHASLGMLTTEQLVTLKAAGLTMVHHNLETSASFFPSICTTHDYAEDVACIRMAQDQGFAICSGGLFGMGESWSDRLELALTLRELAVDSVPINFLTPIPGTPMEGRPLLEPWDALRIVATYRLLLPRAHIRVCGGRERVFSQGGSAERCQVLDAGASGLMVGNFLTTAGTAMESDLGELRRRGFEPL